jgi:DNA adenine methylase
MIQPFFHKINLKKNFTQWIVSNFPADIEDMVYVEPFSGGACVLLNKQKSKIEVINDIDEDIVGIYRAVRDEPTEFIRRLNLYKCSEETFIRSQKKNIFDDYLDRAVNEYITTKMSRGESKKTFSNVVCNRCNKTKSSSWTDSICSLTDLSERIKEVYIFNLSAVQIIKNFNTPNVFLFCDPPFLLETKNKKQMYESEMTTDDHIELSIALNDFSGKVLLTGYMNPLYKRLYAGWNMEKRKSATKTKKTAEIIWKNY